MSSLPDSMHAEECPACGGYVFVCDACGFETTFQDLAADHECASGDVHREERT